jgi:hypothetical protein
VGGDIASNAATVTSALSPGVTYFTDAVLRRLPANPVVEGRYRSGLPTLALRVVRNRPAEHPWELDLLEEALSVRLVAVDRSK